MDLKTVKSVLAQAEALGFVRSRGGNGEKEYKITAAGERWLKTHGGKFDPYDLQMEILVIDKESKDG